MSSVYSFHVFNYMGLRHHVLMNDVNIPLAYLLGIGNVINKIKNKARIEEKSQSPSDIFSNGIKFKSEMAMISLGDDKKSVTTHCLYVVPLYDAMLWIKARSQFHLCSRFFKFLCDHVIKHAKLYIPHFIVPPPSLPSPLTPPPPSQPSSLSSSSSPFVIRNNKMNHRVKARILKPLKHGLSTTEVMCCVSLVELSKASRILPPLEKQSS